MSTTSIEFTEKELLLIQTLVGKQHLIFNGGLPSEFGDTQVGPKVGAALAEMGMAKMSKMMSKMWFPWIGMQS